jgi:hypothetical protein
MPGLKGPFSAADDGARLSRDARAVLKAARVGWAADYERRIAALDVRGAEADAARNAVAVASNSGDGGGGGAGAERAAAARLERVKAELGTGKPQPQLPQASAHEQRGGRLHRPIRRAATGRCYAS